MRIVFVVTLDINGDLDPFRIAARVRRRLDDVADDLPEGAKLDTEEREEGR